MVFELDLDRDYHRQILQTYKLTPPADMPIAVALQPGQDTDFAELLDGVYIWNHTPTAVDLDGFAALVETFDKSDRRPTT